uniref:Uncharacterized protein n=1 Tax=Romanomermis culicivorax TaxID=13658 RepID=A0A915IY35_ROMCU
MKFSPDLEFYRKRSGKGAATDREISVRAEKWENDAPLDSTALFSWPKHQHRRFKKNKIRDLLECRMSSSVVNTT